MSLLEKLWEKMNVKKTLQVQYRMHPTIREFPSLYFYDDKLIDSEEAKKRNTKEIFEDHLKLIFGNVAFFDNKGQNK